MYKINEEKNCLDFQKGTSYVFHRQNYKDVFIIAVYHLPYFAFISNEIETCETFRETGC